MANDSGFFHSAEDLTGLGATFDGWAWATDDQRWLPLYEAKMLSHYDHRFGTYAGMQLEPGQQVRAINRLDHSQKCDPRLESLARYWVSGRAVDEKLEERWDRQWLFGWRDVTNITNERTFVPSLLPRSAVGHKLPLTFPGSYRWVPLFQAVWSSFVFDYVSRQKLSGTSMIYAVVKQIPCPRPETFDQPAPWQPGITLAEYITPRVVELVYTSHRMAPYAQDFGYEGPPFAWDPERRTHLRAELDAAMFHIYGLTRDEVEHVLDTFPIVRRNDERDFGEYRTKRLVLGQFDRMTYGNSPS